MPLPTELVEQILLLLPMKDLLLSQRVSRQFKTVISGSIKLQQALFCAPEKRICNWYFEDDPTSLYFQLHKVDVDTPLGTAGEYAKIVEFGRFNPLFLAPKFEGKNFINYTASCSDFSEAVSVLSFQPPPPNALLPSAATPSWRKMLLAQPPVHHATAHVRNAWGLNVARDLHVSDSCGWTVGHVMDIVNEMDRVARIPAAVEISIHTYHVLFPSQKELEIAERLDGLLRLS